MTLDIGIIGAGIGGLSAAIALGRLGHSVAVYEAASTLAEIGAGIQLTPNASKLLLRWGVGEHLPSLLNSTPRLNIRRWQNGAIIGTMNTENQDEKFGGPHALVHRADLQRALLRIVESHGIEVRLNARIVDYDLDAPSIQLGNGETICIKSFARQKLRGQNGTPDTLATGLAVFRASLDTNDIKDQSDIAYLRDHGLNVWAGPHKMAVAYAMRDESLVNVVLEHPETREPSEWDEKAFPAEIEKFFGDWDPRLVRILSNAKSPSKWPVRRQVPLEKWYSDSGKVLMMGDAAFAVPPFLAQGAAMAIEDAAAVAVFVQQATSIPEMNVRLYHLEDGEEQQRRDSGRTEDPDAIPIWDHDQNQQWLYGYDAEKDASAYLRNKSRTTPLES